MNQWIHQSAQLSTRERAYNLSCTPRAPTGPLQYSLDIPAIPASLHNPYGDGSQSAFRMFSQGKLKKRLVKIVFAMMKWTAMQWHHCNTQTGQTRSFKERIIPSHIHLVAVFWRLILVYQFVYENSLILINYKHDNIDASLRATQLRLSLCFQQDK